MNRLTPRQKEIAILACEGWSNKHMAQKLAIREQSLKNCLVIVYAKLGVSNRIQLVRVVEAVP